MQKAYDAGYHGREFSSSDPMLLEAWDLGEHDWLFENWWEEYGSSESWYYDLDQIRVRFENWNNLNIVPTAVIDARILGCNGQDVVNVIQSLTYENFYSSELDMTRSHFQDAYIATYKGVDI